MKKKKKIRRYYYSKKTKQRKRKYKFKPPFYILMILLIVLAINGSHTPTLTISSVGYADKTITWTSEDNKIEIGRAHV